MVQGVAGDATSHFSDENDGDGDGFYVSEKFRRLGLQSEDLRVYAYLADKSFRRISMAYSYRQVYNLHSISRNPDLNLRLKKHQALVNMVGSMLPPEQGSSQMNYHNSIHHGVVGRPRKSDFVSQQVTEKLKASNFSASLLRIGSWERVSIHEGDLVAKCYYAKKKLVWEFLERSLKRKIEIQWIDILAIRATLNENEPGILEIELKQPPSFHHETDPQPRKHTNWKIAADFTDGQAPMWRRHYLRFPPGALDKPFEKLLQSDSRLFEISQQPFPSLKSPFFYNPSIYEPVDFSFSLHAHRPHFNPALRFSFGQLQNSAFVPEQVQTYQQTFSQNLAIRELASPDSVMEFSPIAEPVGHRYPENPRMPFWGQGVNNFADTFVRDQDPGHMPVPSVTPPGVFYQNSNNYIDAGGCKRDLDTEMLLNDIENTLMSDSQVEYTDENHSLARVASLNALISQSNEGNYLACNNMATNITNYGHNMNMSCAMPMDLSTNQHSNEAAGLIFPPPSIPWMAPQLTDISQSVSAVPPQLNDGMPLNQLRNNSLYPMMNDFTSVNNNNGVNTWL